MRRTCKQPKENGEPCRAAPLTDSDYCFMHDPSVADERAEARRLGGFRRRREKATSYIYEWQGIEKMDEIQRLLEIAITDTLALDNSPRRSRTLGYLASLALKAFEASEIEGRLDALEQLVHHNAKSDR